MTELFEPSEREQRREEAGKQESRKAGKQESRKAGKQEEEAGSNFAFQLLFFAAIGAAYIF